MSRPTILTMDDRDTRREVWSTLLRGLDPIRRVDFLDWCCQLLITTTLTPLPHPPRADRKRMRALVKAAWRGDAAANLRLTNEIYADVTYLCHQWNLDYLRVAVELESWAKGREPTSLSPCGPFQP